MKKCDWTEEYFNEFYLETYSTKLITHAVTELETDFIVKYLKLKKSDLILDLAAGYCRHLNLLAKRDFDVIALDKSLHFLKHGIGNVDKLDMPTCINADMRQLPFRDEVFDKVYLMFNSFGYYNDDENEATIVEIQRIMKKNGLFLLDLPDKDTVLEAISSSPLSHVWDDDFEVIEEWEYLEDRKVLHSQTEFLVGKKSCQTEFFIRLYERSEIETILANAGLSVCGVYGEFDGAPFGNMDTKMIFIAKKL